MRYRWIAVLVFVALIATLGAIQFSSLAGYLLADEAGQARLQSSDPQMVELGNRIYQENCASCHGANLEGQPNWRRANADLTMPAPPHDQSGHTWHHNDETLFKLTKFGVSAFVKDQSYKSNMPAYEGVLEDREIIAVLSYIKSRWPKSMQQRHDKLNEATRR